MEMNGEFHTASPEPVWMSAGNQTPDRPARGLVSILTTLSRLSK